MPKFLIDENLSPHLASRLRRLKYKARSVREAGLRGKPDEAIIAWLQRFDAVLITADLDFGEFFYWKHLGNFGVIVIRSKLQNSKAHKTVLGYLHKQKILKDERLANSLLVVSENKYRWRRFYQ